jgi:hypothetical protein
VRKFTRRVRTLFFLLTASFVICAVGGVTWPLIDTPRATSLKAAPTAPIKTPIQQAHESILAGRFDEAFLLANPMDVRVDLLKEMAVAEKGKDASRKQQLYTAYLEYVPLWNASTYGDLKEWGDVAGKFISSRQMADVAPTPELLQELQAKEIYDQILAISYDHKDTPRASRLAEKLIEKFPETLYCRIGVVAAAGMDSSTNLASSLESYLAQLETRGTTKRTRLAMLALMASESTRPGGSSERALAAHQEILRTGVHESEKAYSLFSVAGIIAARKTPEATEEAQVLYQKYWTTFPKSLSANAARFFYVQTYVNRHELTEALALVEKFRQEDPRWSMAATCYVKIAGEYRAKSDYAAELQILRRATDQYPGTSAAAVAWAMIANRGPGLYGTEEEYEALKKAMVPVTAVIDQPSMDRGEVMRDAMATLTKCYMKRHEWHQCLELCLRPRPSGRSIICGNELEMERLAQCKDVNECVQHLPEDDPLRKEGLDYLRKNGRGQFPLAPK